MARNKYHHYNHVESFDGKKLSMKEKKYEVFIRMVKYRKAKLELEYFDVIDTNEKNKKERLMQYIKYIEDILNSISFESKELILNEFLSRKEDNTWWNKKYSRSAFYKIRENAFDEFLLYAL